MNNRTEFLNSLLSQYPNKNYLEIGVKYGDNIIDTK